ncbi:MAG TPA: type III polyketide synthase, partial [Spirochaetota bacterium]
MNATKVYIHNIATHVPEARYSQTEMREFMTGLMADTDEKRLFFRKIYDGSAISARHTVIDDYGKDPSEYRFFPKNESMKPEPSTAQRNDVHIREANRLSLEAVSMLFEKMTGFDKNKITHLITVSCTGFSAPGVDFHVTKELKLRNSVNRFNLGFMGCFAAIPALKLARNICLSELDARVLIVNTELCSLHFQQSE